MSERPWVLLIDDDSRIRQLVEYRLHMAAAQGLRRELRGTPQAWLIGVADTIIRNAQELSVTTHKLLDQPDRKQNHVPPPRHPDNAPWHAF